MSPNIVLFGGEDSAGRLGLWETDGTTAGTFELTGVTGANVAGICPLSLTLYKSGELLFNGYDSHNVFGLWETDGTAAGTHELTGIAETAHP